MANSATPVTIREYTLAYEGAELIAGLGPGTNPDMVVAAFAMIGMGDDARCWRTRLRLANEAGDKYNTACAASLPANATFFDMIVATDTPSLNELQSEAWKAHTLAENAWLPLAEVIAEVKGLMPADFHDFPA
jgi:hypothetical protein